MPAFISVWYNLVQEKVLQQTVGSLAPLVYH